MKKILTLAIAPFFVLLSNASFALPIAYDFSVSVLKEWQVDARVNSPDSEQIFADNTVMTGSFVYDNEVSPYRVDVPSFSPNAYGNQTFYTAVSGFNATIGGYNYGSDVSSVGMSNSDPSDVSVLDGFFIGGGKYGSHEDGSSNLNGFTIGDWTLDAYVLFGIGNSDYLNDQSLLDIIEPAPMNSGMNLLFSNSAGEERIVQSWPLEISVVGPVSVPEPSSALLLMFGLLLAVRKRIAKK